MLRSCMRSTRWARIGDGSRDQVSIFIDQHLFAEHKAAQLISELLNLFRITGGAKPFGQLEECFFFVLLGLNTLLDELDEHAIIAESALSSQAFDLLRNLRRESYTSPDIFHGR